jgi:capsular polysaccharide export protein
MSDPIHIFSSGLWRLRDEVALLSGLAPVRSWLSVGATGAVAGWGHKPTAERARSTARRRNLPYLAFEDGFLRSLHPGPAQKPASLILDRSGIYYDARSPSDLEAMLESGIVDEAECSRADELRRLIAARRLSKYNDGEDSLAGLSLPRDRPLVLVVDQTFGDESVAGGLADAEAFARMFAAAVSENPQAAVIAKLHPEVVAGAKRGYLREIAMAAGTGHVAGNVCPWALLERRPKVYTVSSQLGFEALIAGCEVVCFGAPFYAGWGLTDDRIAIPRRTRRVSLNELAAAVYLRYSHYFDVWRRRPVDALTAIDQLDFLRRRYLANRAPVVCLGIARWKRRAVAAMLEGPHGKPRFIAGRARAIAEARRRGAAIAAWGIAAQDLRPVLEREGIACLAIEDGFIRSAGLGAAFVQPLSLAVDATGLYYDPRTASDLERLLAEGEFDREKLMRAAMLRQRLIAEKVTKYNLRDAGEVTGLPRDREIVLAVGQVADDWAVRLHRPEAGNINAGLLAAVRHSHPDAYVIFKPHPDVEHLGRSGALAADEESRLADRIARTTSLDSLLTASDRVETVSSLAGFEALLRGLPVGVHGLPFYAGWGLTVDRLHCPRRGRRLSLDELAAAALIDYPRYWDPASGLPCPPEVTLDRLVELRGRAPSPAAAAAALAGRTVIAWRRLTTGGARGGRMAQ